MRSDRSRRSLGLLGVITLATFAGGPSARGSIIGGERVSDAEYSEVFALTYSDPAVSGKKRLCSAVLVHPEVLLTAAHCLPADPGTAIEVLEGANARAPTATVTAHRSVRNAVYFTTMDEIARTGFDVGVIVLDAPIDGADAVTGAKLATLGSILDPRDRAGAFANGVTVVGFGGRKDTGVDATTGWKRTADTNVLEMNDFALTTSGPHGGISHGDSGGPAFVRVNGRLRLLGIASGSPEDESGTVPAHPDVSLYAGMRPEIACWIERAADRGLPALPGSIGCPKTTSFGSK